MNSGFDNLEEDNSFFKQKKYSFSNGSQTKSEYQENESLSLRKKKRKNKFISQKLSSIFSNDLKYEINLGSVLSNVENSTLFQEYSKSQEEIPKLNFLLQMLLENDINILKFSLFQIKNYLINKIDDDSTFIEKNLSNTFNKEMFCHLFNLLEKYSKNDNNNTDNLIIIYNILFIISKFCNLNSNFYQEMILSYVNLLINIYTKNNNEKIIKNIILIVINHLFECNEEMIKKFEIENQNLALIAYKEFLSINKSNIVTNINFFNTLLQIFSNMFYTKTYINYLFSYDNNYINNGEIRVINIINYIKNFITASFDKEIFMQQIICIKNFLSFYSNEIYNHKGNSNYNITIPPKDIEKAVKNLIYSLSFEKNLVPYISEKNSLSPKEYSVSTNVLKILVNATKICPSKFSKLLITDGDISHQLIQLQNFLKTYKMEKLYKLHLKLIHNLVETQNPVIIKELCLNCPMISNLFELNNLYCEIEKKIEGDLISIFDYLIRSDAEYLNIHLLIEGTCEFFKNILEKISENINEKNERNIKIIINDIIKLVNDDIKIKEKYGGYFLIGHLEKIGLIDTVNNLKRNEKLSIEILELIRELNNLLKV